jgi:hypothetical protein
MSDKRFDHEWYGMDDYDKGQYLDNLLKSRNFWRRITVMLLLILFMLVWFAKSQRWRNSQIQSIRKVVQKQSVAHELWLYPKTEWQQSRVALKDGKFRST